MTRHVRLGASSRARVKAGGKLAQGRRSVSLARWREIVAEVKWRARGRCEVASVDAHGCVMRCGAVGRHPHHVVPRSAGGADAASNTIWICLTHHRTVEAPYSRGRLLIRALDESGLFWCKIVFAADKFAARGQG